MNFYRRSSLQVFCKESSLLFSTNKGHQKLALKDTGLRIWELLEYPTSKEILLQNLSIEYGVDLNTLDQSVSPYLKSLKEAGVLEEVPEAVEDFSEVYRYLNLLKRNLANFLYAEHELRIHFADTEKFQVLENKAEKTRYLRDIRYRETEAYGKLIANKVAIGLGGGVNYCFPHTMVGLASLDNIERCAEHVFREGIEGDFFEAGVCQGGAAVFMRGLQQVYSQSHRKTWLADSFQGLPENSHPEDVESGIDWREFNYPHFTFNKDTVQELFQRYDLLDTNVEFLEGWFSDTLPNAPVDKISLLRIDADMYESTMQVLENLYEKVSSGGFVIVDDYGFLSPCRKAVDEFRTANGIEEPIHFVNHSCIYWQKA